MRHPDQTRARLSRLTLRRVRADNGDAVTDWASPPAQIYALMPSVRHLATKARVFLEAVATRLDEL